MNTGIPFPNISPEIFTISLFGMDFSLRWYSMAYLVGILIGWRIIVAVSKRPGLWPNNESPINKQVIEDLFTAIIIGVIVGGRLGYVILYQHEYFLRHPLEIPFIWQGGMSFHGGFIGVVVAVIWVARKHSIPLGTLANVVALSATPAIFLVRIANFINAELWGRPTTLPWGVIFPGDAAQTCDGIAYGTCARHPSQLYEAGLEGLILGLILFFLAFQREWLKKPWSLVGVFLIGYGISRFILEFVRQPDAQFTSPDNPIGWVIRWGDMGLTMGQVLSLPMILLGVFVLLRIHKKT